MLKKRLMFIIYTVST